MPKCTTHKVRELAPTIEWCAQCGAHRRLQARRWTKWIPCGIQRLPRGATTLDDLKRQLTIGDHVKRLTAELDRFEPTKLGTPDKLGTPAHTLRLVDRS